MVVYQAPVSPRGETRDLSQAEPTVSEPVLLQRVSGRMGMSQLLHMPGPPVSDNEQWSTTAREKGQLARTCEGVGGEETKRGRRAG